MLINMISSNRAKLYKQYNIGSWTYICILPEIRSSLYVTSDRQRLLIIFDYCVFMAISKSAKINATKRMIPKSQPLRLCCGLPNVNHVQLMKQFVCCDTKDNEIVFNEYTYFTMSPNVALNICLIEDEQCQSVILVLDDLQNVVWADVSWLYLNTKNLM